MWRRHHFMSLEYRQIDDKIPNLMKFQFAIFRSTLFVDECINCAQHNREPRENLQKIKKKIMVIESIFIAFYQTDDKRMPTLTEKS